MENKEEDFKFGFDQDGSAKRRISSILKAPRTSMKVFAAEQDENQQEETRPIEKRRNSRRVSFAATNNVRVFSKDLKNESPVLAPIQNVNTGLDPMINPSSQFHQLKDPNSFLQDDLVDRTMLLGEDTGYMDMTHSHTISIEKEDVINAESSFNMFASSGGHYFTNLMPCKNSDNVEKDAVHLEFSDFLSSLSKPSGQKVVAFSKKIQGEMDKENVLPTFFKPIYCPEPQVLQARNSEVVPGNEQTMDITKSHTVVIDRMDFTQHASHTVGRNRRSTGLNTRSFVNDSDDMDLTCSQTATINMKDVENLNHNMSSANQRRSRCFSNDVSGMDMTQALDEYIHEQEQKVRKDEAMFISTQARRISSFNQSEIKQLSEKNTTRDISFAPMADCDDMEITQSQTVVLETKYGGEPFRKSFVAASSSTDDSSRVKTNEGLKETRATRNERPLMDTVLYNEQSDFMELTCQASTLVMSPTPDDMDLTGCNTVAIDSENILPTNKMPLRKRASFMVEPAVSLEVEMAHQVKSNESNYDDVVDDMEMTQCQTVLLETKGCGEYNQFGKSAKSLDFTGYKAPKRCSFSERRLTERSVPSVQMLEPHGLPDSVKLDHISASDMLSAHADMDLTGCRTVTIDALNMMQSLARVSSSRPVMSDKMETSRVIGVKPVTAFVPKTVYCKSPVSEMEMDALSHTGNHKEAMSHITGIDLIKGQTVLADPKNSQTLSLSNKNESSSLNLTCRDDVFDEDCNMEMTRALTQPIEDCSMEITRALTQHIEEQCSVAFNESTKSAETLSSSTDTYTFKKVDGALPMGAKAATSVENKGFAIDPDVDMKKERPNSRRRSLADIQLKLQNIAQSIGEPNGLVAGSVTTPIASFTVISPVDTTKKDNVVQSFREANTFKNKLNFAQKEGTTQFNLKKSSLVARLSLGGIMPKLRRHARSTSPNQTEHKSTDGFEDIHSKNEKTHVDSAKETGSYESDFLDNEVLPEEDFSGTAVSYLSSKIDEHEPFTVVPTDENVLKHDDNVSSVISSQYEEMLLEEKYASQNESSPTLNEPGITTKDTYDSSSNSNTTKCEGISESTLRSSQLDSQVEATLDHELDFFEKLEDGSITVNDLLNHFGVKSVIHKSRPSAVPDNFRAAKTHTMEDSLKDKYIYRPKQRVYEKDCQKLTKMAEGFKSQMAEQDKPLKNTNEALLQSVCAFSKVQLQRFGTRLKEQRVFYRKKSKAFSNEIKKELYSELLKTTQDAKHNLMCKIKETNEMLKELDGCVNELESELEGMNGMVVRDQQVLLKTVPVLKAKQEDLDALNSEVAQTEKHFGKLEVQAQTLEETQVKLQDETRGLEHQITTINSLNEWRFCDRDDHRIVFTFLHGTLRLEVKPKKVPEAELVREDVVQDVEISFKFLLNGEGSQSHAVMIHQLLANYIQSQKKWGLEYPTTQHIPLLLHDVSLVVGRLRLLGEEIHQLKKWGGLKFGILQISCVDAMVDITFSSVRAFAKFDLSLAVKADYPFGPVQIQKFQNHIGNTRVDQIEDILSSVTPAKKYLTKVIRRIHSDLLC
ncbi:uncharacterized protein knl1 [Trichomycterus rosablanca]|uniref:uncharacterized protein knl1 n=1 Tax=Trichomycterus rosablanca TaxID=2290929 RepID=UPI002F355851